MSRAIRAPLRPENIFCWFTFPWSTVRCSKVSSAIVLIPQKFMVTSRVFFHNSRFPSGKKSEVSSVIVLLFRNKSITLTISNTCFRDGSTCPQVPGEPAETHGLVHLVRRSGRPGTWIPDIKFETFLVSLYLVVVLPSFSRSFSYFHNHRPHLMQHCHQMSHLNFKLNQNYADMRRPSGTVHRVLV